MKRWSEVREILEELKSKEPQKGTLGTRAMNSVEEGLSYLAQLGFNFEICPRGTLVELTTFREIESGMKTLSIADGKEQVKAEKTPQLNLFEARTSQ